MIRERLKQETAPYHDKIELDLDLLNPAYTKDDYLNLLTKFYGYYASIEPRFADYFSTANVDFNYEDRRKLPLLEQDLAKFGFSAAAIHALPKCAQLPALETRGDVFGTLYVLEGSTLGGQLISKNLRERWDITPENGSAFFSAYKEKTGFYWQSFIKSLESNVVGDDELAHAITAAQGTFTSLGTWMKA